MMSNQEGKLLNDTSISAAEREQIKETLRNMTPDEAFLAFDGNNDGLITFNEFRSVLPYLAVKISDAKALRYFKMSDTRGNSAIDVDEFKTALFACDSTNGNSAGFTPTREVSPLDAFETFDEDETGFIDEDEFYFAMQYLGYTMNDAVHEAAFRSVDYNNTGSIDWYEFRELFILHCDVRKELEDRNIELPTIIPKKAMRKQLRNILLDEEIRERSAIAEAERQKLWMFLVRDKKRFLQGASFRSYRELRNALDAAGHVYVFGKGTNNQFNDIPANDIKTSKFKFEHLDRLNELWTDRVAPLQLVTKCKSDRRRQEAEIKRDNAKTAALQNDPSNNLLHLDLKNPKKRGGIIIDPYSEALESLFHGLRISRNTAALWGRRIHHVAVSESVVLALADTGECYCWGGKSHWWDTIQEDSVYNTKWKGDVTPRSQLMLGVTGNTLPPLSKLKVLDRNPAEEKKTEAIKTVTKYFGVYEAPPNAATRDQFFQRQLLPKLQYDAVKNSLFCRGKTMAEMTKMELIMALYEDILLETKLLGERGHEAVQRLELLYTSHAKKTNKKDALSVLGRIDELWAPLREMQAERKAADAAKKINTANIAAMTIETDYVDWRRRIADKRDDMTSIPTSWGEGLEIQLHGVTPRGPGISTPRGAEAAIQVAAGSAHACLVHKSGQLYTWGLGAAGRLGLDLTLSDGNPQSNAVKPHAVQALTGCAVIRVSCGFSHTGAVLAGGELFMWGSTVTGKCGLGPVTDRAECYCSVPSRVLVGDDKKVGKISCGAAHTAAVTERGRLYVFGCGDGGRLGLGVGFKETIYTPTLVSCLLHERVFAVSCGNSTTLALTMLTSEVVGADGSSQKVLGGGRVYMAGSGNVLGAQYDVMSLLQDLKDTPVKQVSAGYQHSAVVTVEGELHCWGHNKGGCCGRSEKILFLPRPVVAQCMHTTPLNIALKCSARQSSTYNSREASLAVNGQTDGSGLRFVSCTQLEKQAWLEINLGGIASIESIKIWNRTDSPGDKGQRSDLYSCRLFPCWVMMGMEPFETLPDPSGGQLVRNLEMASCKTRFSSDQRVSVWACPRGSQARYVRVQLEGDNFLSLAEVEVFGHIGMNAGVSRVSYAVAGRDVTVAVVRPSNDPTYIESVYTRAVHADAGNADILRQFETYALEYDKFGRGEVLVGKCTVCVPHSQCETCSMHERCYDDLKLMPPKLGKRATLQEMHDYLIDSCKPDIRVKVVPLKVRPKYWEEKTKEMMLQLKNMALLRPQKTSVGLSKGFYPETKEEDVVGDEEESEEGDEQADGDRGVTPPRAAPLAPKYYGKKGRRAQARALLQAGRVKAQVPVPIDPSDGVDLDRGNQIDTGSLEQKKVRFADSDSVSIDEVDSLSMLSFVSKPSSIGSFSLSLPSIHLRSAIPKSISTRKSETATASRSKIAEDKVTELNTKMLSDRFVLLPHQISSKKGRKTNDDSSH